jgi:hypothetical protein
MGIKNTEQAQHLSGQPGFTRLVANLEGGGTPDKGVLHNASIIRTAWTSDHPAEGGNAPIQGLLTAPGVTDRRPVGVLTVADNDFTTGPAAFFIGDIEFRAGTDFIIGALAGNTASNIAATINNHGYKVRGWSAVAVGADVTIRYAHPGRIRFEARHNGTKTNFTLSTSNGLMDYGATEIAPPTVTP